LSTTVEERLRPVEAFAPEIAPINFGLYGMPERHERFEHGWEDEIPEKSRDLAFRDRCPGI
jgi:hypothetical protein